MRSLASRASHVGSTPRAAESSRTVSAEVQASTRAQQATAYGALAQGRVEKPFRTLPRAIMERVEYEQTCCSPSVNAEEFDESGVANGRSQDLEAHTTGRMTAKY